MAWLTRGAAAAALLCLTQACAPPPYIAKCGLQEGFTGRIDCWTAAIEEDPDCVDFYRHRARAYKDSYKFFSAVDDYRIVFQYHPGDSMICYEIACIFGILHMEESTLLWLERAFEKGFRDSTMLFQTNDLEYMLRAESFKELVGKYLGANRTAHAYP